MASMLPQILTSPFSSNALISYPESCSMKVCSSSCGGSHTVKSGSNVARTLENIFCKQNEHDYKTIH